MNAHGAEAVQTTRGADRRPSGRLLTGVGALMRDLGTTRNTDVDVELDGAGRRQDRAQAVSQQLQHTLRSGEPQTALAAAAREITERRRSEQLRRREQVVRSLHGPGSGRSTREPPGGTGVIVGVEAERAEPTLVAHAVHDLRALTPWLGIASCGLPAEYLTLVPEIAWVEVDPRIRCPHCDSAGVPGA